MGNCFLDGIASKMSVRNRGLDDTLISGTLTAAEGKRPLALAPEMPCLSALLGAIDSRLSSAVFDDSPPDATET